jgi:TrpR-related protein YerC/YecD
MATKLIRNEKVPHDTNTNELLEAFLMLRTRKELSMFFRDILTSKEITEIGKRWKVARMLHENIPYTVIEKQTKMSSTTIARIHKWLEHGAGGYTLLIKKLYGNKK